MGNWFGNLNLAYKYTVVFVSLLAFTIAAGFIKVFFDRRKMKKLTAQANEEAGQREDQMELNQREKDEGDLFGVRAIEAGFYAGIPQSRPTSRAGSPSMSSTLLGGYNSPKIQTSSMASSVTDLPLAHTNNRESLALPLDSSSRRKSPPTIRLAPSEAEINGRHNLHVDVNMSLNVPPSPVLTKIPRSPTFDGSDDENDAPQHYVPTAPQLPIPQGLQGSLMSNDDLPKSQAASFSYTDVSTDTSPLPSPGQVRTVKPSMPEQSLSSESTTSSPYPPYNAGPQSLPSTPSIIEPTQPVLVLPTSNYEPSHKRHHSGASSVYSEKRTSTYQVQPPAPQHERTTPIPSSYKDHHSFPEKSNRNSVALGALKTPSSLVPSSTSISTMTSKESKRQSSANSSLLAPGSMHSNGNEDRQSTNDPRFSDFYDAYYRNSHLVKDAPKRPEPINTEATIVEVPTPLSTPALPQGRHQPGMAL